MSLNGFTQTQNNDHTASSLRLVDSAETLHWWSGNPMKIGSAVSIFSKSMCNKRIVVFSKNIFHCWPIDFNWAILSCQGVDNVETKCLQIPHPPLCRERGDPHLLISVAMYVFMNAQMNVHASGLLPKCMHHCVSVCVYVCMYAHTYVCIRGRTRPPRFYIYCNRTSLPGFAIGCYGNKGTEWSGCSS